MIKLLIRVTAPAAALLLCVFVYVHDRFALGEKSARVRLYTIGAYAYSCAYSSELLTHLVTVTPNRPKANVRAAPKPLTQRLLRKIKLKMRRRIALALKNRSYALSRRLKADLRRFEKFIVDCKGRIGAPVLPSATPLPSSSPTPEAQPTPTITPTNSHTPVPAVRTVYIRDNYFDPSILQINEGDEVVWVWEAEVPHNVVAGHPRNSPPVSYFEIFDSPEEIDNFSYRFTFSRAFLNQHPSSDGVYHYYCRPHELMGMVGGIQVARYPKSFVSDPRAYQMVPPTGSAAGAECKVVLAADERSVKISCLHGLPAVTKIEFHQGYVGDVGPLICTIPGAAGQAQGSCAVDLNLVRAIFDGETYLVLSSQDYPQGEIRGQILQDTEARNIYGTVRLANGQGLSDVIVSDGARQAVTDQFGDYQLLQVPSGVYILSAGKSGFNIEPDLATNPAVVNGRDLFLRDFTAN